MATKKKSSSKKTEKAKKPDPAPVYRRSDSKPVKQGNQLG